MTFLHPWVLAVLLVFPLIFWLSRRKRKAPAVVYSDIRLLSAKSPLGRARWVWFPRLLLYGSAVLATIALARPQERNVRQEILAPGIDIALALDMSTSMLSNDFAPNRFVAAKEVLKRFVASRSTDRVALVVFAGRSYTQVPLTFDYNAVQSMIDALAIGQLEDGTAIGMGMVEAINRLKVSNAKSKVIILLTDGVNNRGRVDPKTAGEIAKLKGIRVYTVGMGMRAEQAPKSVFDRAFGRGASQEGAMNYTLLEEIATSTGGKYFEAANMQDLTAIYDTIGSLEKSEVKMNEYVTVKEWYPYFLRLALLALIMGWFLEITIFRRVP